MAESLESKVASAAVSRRWSPHPNCLWILALVVAGAGCTAPARGFCEAAAACDDDQTPHDGVGESDDSADVCTAEAEGTLAVLRQNDEPECHELADALEQWFLCVQEKHAEGEECAGLRAGNDNECQSELDDVEEKQTDAGRACTEDEE